MKKKEYSIPNCPRVYRVVDVSQDGVEKTTGYFRVRKREKNQFTGQWTTSVKTFADFTAAKRFSKMRSMPPVVRDNLSDTFKEVFERFYVHKEKRQLRRGSLDGFRSRFEHLEFFQPLPMSKITPQIVDRWLDLIHDTDYKRLQRVNRLNYQHEYTLLSGIFNYYRNYENDSFIIPLLKRHREVACARPKDKQHERMHFLNEDEEIGFLNALKVEDRFHDLALLQLNTGLRIGEAAALQFRNIDFKKSELVICQHLDWPRRKGANIVVLPGTKSGASRWVPLTQECRDMLMRRKSTSKNDRVFTDPRNDNCWIAYRQIQYAYDRAFAKVSETVRGSHALRHTFAVRYLNQTKDIHALQRLLGHASLEETQGYAKYTNESVRQSFQLFKGGKAADLVPSTVPQNLVSNLRHVIQGT